MSMFCVNCGKQIPADANFCPYCGQRVPEAARSSAPPPAVPPTAQPAAGAPAAPAPTAVNASEPAGTSAATPASPAATGPWVVIYGTGNAGAYLRRTPRRDDRLNAWPEQTRLAVVGPDAESEGIRWRHVQAPDGQSGWIPADYVRAIDPATGAVEPIYIIIVTPQATGLYLRRTPRLADRLSAWADGTRCEVIGPDVEGDGQRWKHVRSPSGEIGYIVTTYTQPAPSSLTL